MFVPITNTPRRYAWGSTTAISELLGTEASGEPEAELWFGTHPGSPAALVAPEPDGPEALTGWLERRAGANAEEEAALPFLLKVLAAEKSLSLQAHPTAEQARAGFDRENRAGVALDAPDRNYRDPFAKPEIIYALSEEFHALCGFRTSESAAGSIRALGDDAVLRAFATRAATRPIAETFEWLVTRGEGVDELVSVVVDSASSGDTESAQIVQKLADEHPGDPGIAVSLLLNPVTLSHGEAMFLSAGSIHAYLSGLGIELMASSDNVLRGGLTVKHVDVAELLAVVDFTQGDVAPLTPTRSGGVEVLAPDGAGISLARVTGEGQLDARGPAIILCVEGRATVSGEESATELGRGDAVFVTPSEGVLRFEGTGDLFIAGGAPEGAP